MMSKLFKLLILLAAVALCLGAAEAVTSVTIVDTVSPGITTNTGLTGSTWVYARGYYSIGDGGGGYFKQTLISVCSLSIPSVTYSAGYSINLSTSGITAGTSISGTGIPAGDTVATVKPTGTILLKTAGSGGTGVTLTFGGSHGVDGGSVVADGSYNCWTRKSGVGSVLEWGAYIDFSTGCTPYPSSGAPNCHDDTVSFQNWLNANGPHNMPPGNALITSPLTCPMGVAIQGAPSAASAVGGQPQSQIFAFSSSAYGGFPSPSAMLFMSAQCAIHSLGLIADGSGLFDAVDATDSNDLIDQHSLLSGGAYNVNASYSGANLEIYDSSLKNSCYDNRHVASGKANIKLVRNSFAASGQAFTTGTPGPCAAPGSGVTGNNITFYDSDALISDNIIQNACGNGIYLSTEGPFGGPDRAIKALAQSPA